MHDRGNGRTPEEIEVGAGLPVRNVLLEINNERKGRNGLLSKDIHSTMPTASTGLSTFARAAKSKKESGTEMLSSIVSERVSSSHMEHQRLITTGRNIFPSRPSTNSFPRGNSATKLKG